MIYNLKFNGRKRKENVGARGSLENTAIKVADKISIIIAIF